MENPNIQYRKLRDHRRGRTGHFSITLLGHHANQPPVSSQNKEDIDNIMSKNVVEYQHLLKNPLLHLKEVDWVSKLREPFANTQLQSDEVELPAPSVFAKTTQARTHYLAKNSEKKQGFNTADFQQVLGRRKMITRIQSGVLSYMTNLRVYPADSAPKNSKDTQKKQNQSEKAAFSSIPFVQRNQQPKFLKKQSLKKAKIQKKQQLQTALDGSQNFPPYSQKIVKERNYGILCTFTSGSQKISLPGLAWQMGLRS